MTTGKNDSSEVWGASEWFGTRREPHCLRCGRELHSVRSIRAGYGQECWTAVLSAAQTADLSDWSDTQVDDALELLRDGGISLHRQGRNPVYRVVGNDGRYHFTAPQLCTCEAGRWGRMCYHRAAVKILLRSFSGLPAMTYHIEGLTYAT